MYSIYPKCAKWQIQNSHKVDNSSSVFRLRAISLHGKINSMGCKFFRQIVSICFPKNYFSVTQRSFFQIIVKVRLHKCIKGLKQSKALLIQIFPSKSIEILDNEPSPIQYTIVTKVCLSLKIQILTETHPSYI